MCLTLFSFPISYARLDDDVRSSSQVDGEGMSVQATEDALRALQTKNPFEMTLSELILNIGDKILDYIVYLYNDDITIDRIVFNKVQALDPNFFKYNGATYVTPTAEIFCNVINGWYRIFNGIAIVFYMFLLVVIGIKIVLRKCILQSGCERVFNALDDGSSHPHSISLCDEICF